MDKCLPMMVLALMTCTETLRAQGRAHDPHCGVKCLYVAVIALGVESGSYEEFVAKCGPIESQGLSIGRIQELAESYGIETLAVETSIKNLSLREERFVCLAHLDGSHFVLLGDVNRDVAWVIDPPAETEVACNVLNERWDGKALLMSRQPLALEEDLHERWLSLTTVVWIGIVIAVSLSLIVWRMFR